MLSKGQRPSPAAISLPCLRMLQAPGAHLRPQPFCSHAFFFFFLPSITKDFMSFIIFFFIVKSSSQHHGKSNSRNIPMFQMGQIRAQNEGFPRTLVAK